MTTILIKKKDTAGAPAPGDLTNAAGGTEIAVNTATKRVYTKDSGGTVVELGTNPSALTTNLLFSPDATYDIGASGASRPRDLFLSRDLTVGGTMTVAGGINFNGNVTVGDSSADTLTINSTITSNLIFTDNTYDIGASGATRPRNLYLANNLVVGGSTTLSGGVANGIVYLDGSKVATTSTSFTWNGTNNFNLTTNTESGAAAPLISSINSNSGTTQLKIFHSGSDLGIYNAREALLLGSKNTFDAQVYNGAISIGDTAMTGNRLSLVRSTEQSVGPVQIFKNLYRGSSQSARQMGLMSFGSWRDVSTSGSYCSAIEGYQSGDSGTYGQLRFYTNDNGSNDPQYPVTSGRRNLILFPDGATFNDAALDMDFRVASDTNTYALFLDAGNSRIGINNNSPTEALTVSGNIYATNNISAASAVSAVSSVAVNTGNGTVQMRDIGGSSGSNGLELQVRPNAGKTGWLTFAENAVADRWAVGIVNGDGSLYFKSNLTTSVTQQLFRSGGGAIFNVSQNDSDFNVRTQASQYGFMVQTSTNRVGINQSSPAGRFEVNQDEAIPGIWLRDNRTGGRPTMVFYNREIASPAITGQILFGGFRDVRNPSYSAAILGYNFSSGFGNSGRITINVGSNGEDTISSLPAAVVTVDTGGVTITGSLSKSSGSFRIDHPLPALAETHDLVHSFVEAPQADNLYRGKATLVNGRAEVNIDEAAGMTSGTFVLLNREVQCFTTNESDWVHVRGSVSGNILTIEAQDQTATSSISWMVIGERKDKHMYDTDWTDENGKVIVEPIKKPIPDIPEAPTE